MSTPIPHQQNNAETLYGDQKNWFDRVMQEIRDLLEYHPQLKQIVFKEVSQITRYL